MATGFSHGRALIIGIANYPSVSRLPKAVIQDARDVAELLSAEKYCGYPPTNVELLLDGQATADGIQRGLRQLAETTGPKDTAVVFFSGHGGRVEKGPEAGTYLFPFDCDPQRLRDTSLDSEELTNLLRSVKAGRLVVLLDACHSAGAGEKSAPPVEPVV
jgi:hypothetical protein